MIKFSEYSNYALFPEFESGLSEFDEKKFLQTWIAGWNKKAFLFHQDSQYLCKYGGSVGVGVSGGIPLGCPETRLQITFYFVDVEDDALIWQAVVDSQFNIETSPQQRQAQFEKIVQKDWKVIRQINKGLFKKRF